MLKYLTKPIGAKTSAPAQEKNEDMTNEQLYLAMGVPILFNGILAVVITTLFSARLSDMRAEFRELMAAERRTTDAHFKHIFDKLEELDTRLERLEAKG